MATDIRPLIGGCGGVYFLAQPGELVVEVVKRDRNAKKTTTDLRALLIGPDRTVLQEATIPDDGNPVGSGLGPARYVRLSTRVDRPGVYSLNVTVSQDRYGTEMLWGFSTNCPKYIIETARGHKDERHQEPIVLGTPDQPADVCFRPRPRAINIEASGLPKGSADLQLFDSAGAVLATLPVDAEGKASCAMPAGERGEGELWRLHLPAAQAVLNVDGLTRWDKGDPNENVCCWSPELSSWFPLLENWWLLTPYSRTVYAEPGSEEKLSFSVHNSAALQRDVKLSLEYPEAQLPIRLGTEEVTLAPGATQSVDVSYTMPADTPQARCHIRATPSDAPDYSTYCTLTLKAGEAPAQRPLTMPLQLLPYRHENEQFGYLPDYPTGSQMYFSPDGTPYVQAGGGIRTLRDGQWAGGSLADLVTTRPPSLQGVGLSLTTSKIAFDSHGDVYLPAAGGGKSVLLHSSDAGRSFSAYEIPGRNGGWDIEQFSGTNTPDGPPPIVRFVRTQKDPKLIWRALHDMELILPRKIDGRIEMGEPVLISQKSIGFSGHSGMPSSVVSRGSKVHVVWGEATDPELKVPGVPTFVATYDRDTGKLSAPALVGYGPPANDVHNTPSITMDKDGYLHVLVGTHGRPFQYVSSKLPNDSEGGWTEAVLAGEGLSQTYIGLVCDESNTLHAVFRLWRSGEPYPSSSYATLAYQRKRPGQPWEEPRILIAAPFSEYSVFYHRLTIDPKGRLFLSYDYWSTHWFYRNDHFGSRRALMMSPDGGETWKLVGRGDLD